MDLIVIAKSHNSMPNSYVIHFLVAKYISTSIWAIVASYDTTAGEYVRNPRVTFAIVIIVRPSGPITLNGKCVLLCGLWIEKLYHLSSPIVT